MQETTTQSKTKKNPYKSQALVGAGLLGGGLGLYGASHGVLSDSDHSNLTTFKNLAKDSWAKGQDPRDNLKQYIEYGHRAIAAKPFGIDAVGVMKGLRSHTLLDPISKGLSAVGLSSQGEKIKSFAMPNGGLKHYLQFAQSPLDGYRQLTSEYANGDHGIPVGTTKNLKGMIEANPFGRPSDSSVRSFQQWNNKALDVSKLDPTQMNQNTDAVKSLMNDTQSGSSMFPWSRTKPIEFSANKPELGQKYMATLDKHINGVAKSHNLDMLKATANQKRQVFNSLDSYIKGKDMDFWKQKQMSDYSMGTMMPEAGKMYGNITSPFTGTHDLLKYTGIGAAAAGVGIGGYALYKMLRTHLNKKKVVQEQPVVQSY